MVFTRNIDEMWKVIRKKWVFQFFLVRVDVQYPYISKNISSKFPDHWKILCYYQFLCGTCESLIKYNSKSREKTLSFFSTLYGENLSCETFSHKWCNFFFWPLHFLYDSTTKNEINISFFFMCTNLNLPHLSKMLTKIFSQCKQYWEVKSRETKYYRLPSHQRQLYISPIFPRFEKYLIISASCRIFSTQIIRLEIISRNIIRLQNFFEDNFSSWWTSR